MTATKTKRNLITEADCIFKTPRSVEDCVAQMQSMTHFDLQVTVVRESPYSAEVNFIERHNDDLPLYITSRLFSQNGQTCITFEPQVSLKKMNVVERNAQLIQFLSWVIMAGIFVVTVTLIEDPDTRFMVLCMAIVLYMFVPRGGRLERNWGSQEESVAMRTGLIKDLMRQRAEVLKEELRATLTIDSSQVQYDVVGNAYYYDVDSDPAESKTSDQRAQ